MKKAFNVAMWLFSVMLLCALGFVKLRHLSEEYSYLKGVDNAKVSVVIPVYNTENYLDECLNTIENQTLKELEIVCVNDGSKDSSLQILKNHAKKDHRIKIVNQKNCGVSVARNNGIKVSKGKYIMFADSDDLIPPYACEKAYQCAEKYNVDVACLGNMCFIDGQNIDVNSFGHDESKISFNTCESSEIPYYALKIEMSSVWNKIWKKSFLIENDIYFKEGISRGEDGLFNIIAFSNVRKVAHDDNIFYCYRQNRPNSALTVSNAKKILESAIPGGQELIKNRYRFNFDNSDSWLVNNILGSTFIRITEDLSDIQDKIYFSRKTIELIEDQLVKQHGVVLTLEQQEKVNVLKEIARG